MNTFPKSCPRRHVCGRRYCHTKGLDILGRRKGAHWGVTNVRLTPRSPLVRHKHEDQGNEERFHRFLFCEQKPYWNSRAGADQTNCTTVADSPTTRSGVAMWKMTDSSDVRIVITRGACVARTLGPTKQLGNGNSKNRRTTYSHIGVIILVLIRSRQHVAKKTVAAVIA